MRFEAFLTLISMLVGGFFVYHRFITSYIDKKLDKEVFKDFKKDIDKKFDEIKEDLRYLRNKS